MSQDRTSEFLSLVRGLPGGAAAVAASSSSSSSSSPDRYGGGANRRGNNNNLTGGSSASYSTAGETSTQNNNKNSNNPAYAELRSFHATAAGISRDIASTSALLQQLTQLVRNKSSSLLFQQDDAAQVNSLVVRIKSSIENLNSRLDQAGRQIAQQKRTLGQQQLNQAQASAANLVDGLKTEFAEAATDFKRVLQQRTDNLKTSADWTQQVYNVSDSEDAIPDMSAALATPPPVYGNHNKNNQNNDMMSSSAFPTLDLTSGMLMSPGESTASAGTATPLLPRPHGIAGGTGGGNHPPYLHSASSAMSDGGGGLGTPLTPHDIQRLEEESGLSQQMQLIPDQDYLRERADAMSTVEQNLVELGAIFNKLAVMVNEHRDMVQRVEDNVEDANTNVNLSMNVLTDTLANLRSNRQLLMRLAPVLLIFIIMFIIFFA